jgi:hypothetical protein
MRIMTEKEKLFKFHKEITETAFSIMERKNKDYASEDDPYLNFRAAENFGIHPVKGIVLRTSDKLARISNFVDNGNLQNESVYDSILDIINYAVLMYGLIKQDNDLTYSVPACEPEEATCLICGF